MSKNYSITRWNEMRMNQMISVFEPQREEKNSRWTSFFSELTENGEQVFTIELPPTMFIIIIIIIILKLNSFSIASVILHYSFTSDIFHSSSFFLSFFFSLHSPQKKKRTQTFNYSAVAALSACFNEHRTTNILINNETDAE